MTCLNEPEVNVWFPSHFFTTPDPTSVYSQNATAATVPWFMDDPIRWQNLNITWLSAWLADFLCVLRAKEQDLCLPEFADPGPCFRVALKARACNTMTEREKVCGRTRHGPQKDKESAKALAWAKYSVTSSLSGCQSKTFCRFLTGIHPLEMLVTVQGS